MKPHFFLARHGLTKDDMPGREKVTGWLQVSLNEAGRGNARSAGKLLKGREISTIISSDLKRTAQTADIISEIIGVPVVESEKLRSWNMGAMEGMLSEAAKPFLTFFQKNPEVTPPKGEPFERFYNRFKGVFYATVAHVRKFPNAHPLLVTHSQDLDIVEWFLDGTEPGEALEFGEGIPPGGLLKVTINEGEISCRPFK